MKKIITSIFAAVILASCSTAKYAEITHFSDYSYFYKNGFEFYHSPVVSFSYKTIGSITVEAIHGGESKAFSLYDVESIKNDKGDIIPQFVATSGMGSGRYASVIPTDFRMMVKFMQEAKSKGADAVVNFKIEYGNNKSIASGIIVKKTK